MFKEAKTAMEQLNGSELNEQCITVDWAFSKGPSDTRAPARRKGRRSRSRSIDNRARR